MIAQQDVAENQRRGRVLVLSGPSSSGKSTVAREFQQSEDTPWLTLDADVVLAAYPFDKAPELATTARRLNLGLFASAAAFARAGVDVICEQVFWNQATYDDARACLDGLPACFVEVTVELDVAEKREARRDERMAGTSREQRSQLWTEVKYDYQLDTTTGTPADAATELAAWVTQALPR